MDVSRRKFLSIGGAGAVGSSALGGSALGFDLSAAHQVKQRLRIAGAKVSRTICPYCAVGCAMLAYTKEQNGHTELLQIEGDPDSPVNEGRLCPKGATALELGVSRRRVPYPMYRAPGKSEWQRISWEEALNRLARNIKRSRDNTFVAEDGDGNTVNRTEGVAFAGGAAFSSEEGYFATKVMRGLGVVHIEQQARV